MSYKNVRDYCTGLFHVRDSNEPIIIDGELYYNGIANNGGATVAYDFNYDPDGNHHVEISVAACSQNDNFNRAVGRAIAIGRLNVGHIVGYVTINQLVDVYIQVFNEEAKPEFVRQLIEDAIVVQENGVILVQEKIFPLNEIILKIFEFNLNQVTGQLVEKIGNHYVSVDPDTDPTTLIP